MRKPKGMTMIDDELDYWPLSMWADEAHYGRFAEELTEATDMEEDEIVACLAFLHDQDNGFATIPGQYTAEDIATVFEKHTLDVYPWWGNLAERQADVLAGKMVLSRLWAVARRTGHQDAFGEMLEQMGREIAQTQGYAEGWWFHAATLTDGRVFRMKRPVAGPPGA